jgi:hypothetical protein
MKHLKLALAVIACGLATSAMATPSAIYSLTGTATTTGNATWVPCAGNTTACSGGTNYGNTYTFANAYSGGPGASVTISAFGATTTTSAITTAWVGDYTPAGLGITSQTPNELVKSGPNYIPDVTGPHAIDNNGGYETLLLSFTKAVTLGSLTAGYANGDSDAVILEYTGTGVPPTIANGTNTYASLLTSGWKLVAVDADIATGSPTYIPFNGGPTASQYWMVGAYMPIGGLSAPSTISDFKINGFTATLNAVPEPGSIALFGLAGVALAVSRRKRARKN